MLRNHVVHNIIKPCGSVPWPRTMSIEFHGPPNKVGLFIHYSCNHFELQKLRVGAAPHPLAHQPQLRHQPDQICTSYAIMQFTTLFSHMVASMTLDYVDWISWVPEQSGIFHSLWTSKKLKSLWCPPCTTITVNALTLSNTYKLLNHVVHNII